MVDRDDDHVAHCAQAVSFIALVLDCGTACKSATMYPYHDRAPNIVVDVLCPNVKILAVFALRPIPEAQEYITTDYIGLSDGS